VSAAGKVGHGCGDPLGAVIVIGDCLSDGAVAYAACRTDVACGRDSRTFALSGDERRSTTLGHYV